VVSPDRRALAFCQRAAHLPREPSPTLTLAAILTSRARNSTLVFHPTGGATSSERARYTNRERARRPEDAISILTKP
jgi:hypothetical protein